MKYFALVRAGLCSKPLNTALTFASMAIAFLMAGIAIGFAGLMPRNGASDIAVSGIVAIGFGMSLILTGNAVAQSVRLRIWEFAVLKTLGFTACAIIALVFAEVAVPCLAGAMAGLGLAQILAGPLLGLLPHAIRLTHSFVPPLLAVGAPGIALLLALVSTAIPASRIGRLNVAAALRSINQ